MITSLIKLRRDKNKIKYIIYTYLYFINIHNINESPNGVYARNYQTTKPNWTILSWVRYCSDIKVNKKKSPR